MTGESVGSSVGEGVGDSVLQMSVYSHEPFMEDPTPKLKLQHSLKELKAKVSATKKALVHSSSTKKKTCSPQAVGAGVTGDPVGLGDGLGVGFGVGFGVGLRVGFGVGFGVGLGVGRGVGLAVIMYVGSGVSGEGVGMRVLHSSTKSQFLG